MIYKVDVSADYEGTRSRTLGFVNASSPATAAIHFYANGIGGAREGEYDVSEVSVSDVDEEVRYYDYKVSERISSSKSRWFLNVDKKTSIEDLKQEKIDDAVNLLIGFKGITEEDIQKYLDKRKSS